MKLVVMLQLFFLTAAFTLPVVAQLEKYAFCDDCWCVPEAGETCPYNSIRETNFSDTMIENLIAIHLENPLSLSCDPYYDDTCDTVPPLETGGVCAVEIVSNGTKCPEEFSYRLVTMTSWEEAEASGFIVTHEGSCGTCSTFQDLAVYMTTPDLSEVGTSCAFRAIVDFADGVECYRETGFSDACAASWVYNTNNTRAKCLSPCLEHSSSGLPNNLPAPGCELAECMQCDEDNSGDLFKKFAGRTRRNSGLLSKIVRPCSSIATILHQDPCAVSLVPKDNSTANETFQSDASSSAGRSMSLTPVTVTTSMLWIMFLVSMNK